MIPISPKPRYENKDEAERFITKIELLYCLSFDIEVDYGNGHIQQFKNVKLKRHSPNDLYVEIMPKNLVVGATRINILRSHIEENDTGKTIIDYKHLGRSISRQLKRVLSTVAR